MPSDKYLLIAFISALIGFVTAAMSIVRLVNDKESKTTDYRQAWTESLRTSFANLLAKVESVTSARLRHINKANLLFKMEKLAREEQQDVKDAKDYHIKVLTEMASSLERLDEDMHSAYALTRLHFKPNDLSFARVEHKFDHITDLLQRLARTDGVEATSAREELVGSIRVATAELTGFARDILKTEWEAVKRGEQAYQTTKRWSVVAGGVTLAILLLFGGFSFWSANTPKADSASTATAATIGQVGSSLTNR